MAEGAGFRLGVVEPCLQVGGRGMAEGTGLMLGVAEPYLRVGGLGLGLAWLSPVGVGLGHGVAGRNLSTGGVLGF